jgi:hypothetical protein
MRFLKIQKKKNDHYDFEDHTYQYQNIKKLNGNFSGRQDIKTFSEFRAVTSRSQDRMISYHELNSQGKSF